MADLYQPKKVLQDFNLDASVPDVVQPASTITPVENTGGLSATDLAPTNLDLDQKVLPMPEPSALAALGAGMFSTARDWYGGFNETYNFEKDPEYIPKADADEWFRVNGTLSADEVEYLNQADSYPAMIYRQEKLQEKRDRDAVIAQRPVWGMIGSLADVDLVTSFVPLIGQGTWANRLGHAAAYATAVTGVNMANENTIRSNTEIAMDALAFGAGGLFTNTKAVSKAYGSPQAVATIQAEQATKATTNGTLGTATVMGTDVHIPISQPPRVTEFDVPDWAKGTVNKVGEFMESSADTMYRFTNDNPNDPLNNLLATPRTQGDNATYHAAAVHGELDTLLLQFEDALDTTTTAQFGTRGWVPWQRTDHKAHQQVIMRDFQEAMQLLDRQVIDQIQAGIPLQPQDIESFIKASIAQPHIKDLMQKYVNSGFAETAYDHFRRVGLIDDEVAQRLPRRPTYTPLQHDYDKLNGLLRSGIEPDTLYKFIGEQILGMYPALLNKNFTLTAKQLGMNFIRTQEKNSLDIADIRSTGISSDRMRELLANTTLNSKEIDEVLDQLVPESANTGSNSVRNLRRRIEWDWGYVVTDPKTGRTISMSDIVNNDMVLTLQDYARNTSKRVGLAQYGFKAPSELDEALEAMVSNRPKNVSMDEARRFAKGVRDSLLGLPTGEPLPPMMRSLNTLGGSMVLSNSGIWGIMDLATQTMKLGLIRSLPELVKGIKHAVTPLNGLSKSEASSLYDILTQRISSEGRWKKWTTRYEDNFEVPTGFHEGVSFYGQSTKFLNFSEAVKRFQVGLMGGIFVSAFEGAAKGSAKDIKFLKQNLKMSDQLVQDIATQYKQFGGTIDNWDNNVRVAMEQKVFFEADNMAHTIHTGELPKFMEHSTVGKAIFPFLSFTMAMQQKVLKHTLARDGIAGLLSVLAVQLPTAAFLGMVKNIKDGKDPEDNLASTSMNALSILGMWSLPLGALDQGGFRGGATVFTPFNKGLGLTNKLFSEDTDITGRDIKSAAPFVGAMTALDLFLSAIEE